MKPEEVLISKKKNTALIVLNREKQLNALTLNMCRILNPLYAVSQPWHVL